MNPILQQINGNNQGLPTSMDDPRMQNAKDYVAQHGGDPKKAFYALCNERGLNPIGIINKIIGGNR